MTEIVPVKQVFSAHVWVCVCVCMEKGELRGKMERGGRGGEWKACICMGLIHVGNVCGWYACRLWGIRMPSFSLSICTPSTCTHADRHIQGWEESLPCCEDLCSINTTHPISQHLLPHLPLPLHHLYFSLPGSDTEFFLTAVHSLQSCNPHTPCTLFSPPLLSTTLSPSLSHKWNKDSLLLSSNHFGFSLKTW